MRYHENCVSLGTHCLSCLSFPNDFSGHCRSSNDLSVTNNSQTVLSRTSFCRTKQQPNCPCSCTWRHIQPISDCHLQRQACRTKAHKAQSSLGCFIMVALTFPFSFPPLGMLLHSSRHHYCDLCRFSYFSASVHASPSASRCSRVNNTRQYYGPSLAVTKPCLLGSTTIEIIFRFYLVYHNCDKLGPYVTNVNPICSL